VSLNGKHLNMRAAIKGSTNL